MSPYQVVSFLHKRVIFLHRRQGYVALDWPVHRHMRFAFLRRFYETRVSVSRVQHLQVTILSINAKNVFCEITMNQFSHVSKWLAHWEYSPPSLLSMAFSAFFLAV